MSRRARSRDELDAICWATLDAMVPRTRRESPRSAGVRDYVELWHRAQATQDLAGAWSSFLHEFFRYRDPGCFGLPPSPDFGRAHCAMLAGTAEYLSRRYGLPIPAWTEEARYFLEGRWEPLPNFEETASQVWVPFPFMAAEHTWARSEEEFRRRGLVFQARNLITL